MYFTHKRELKRPTLLTNHRASNPYAHYFSNPVRCLTKLFFPPCMGKTDRIMPTCVQLRNNILDLDLDLDRHQVRMASQTQSQRMQDLDLDLKQVDLDLLEFLILQPEQNQDLGLLFKVCNMRPKNRETPGYRK